MRSLFASLLLLASGCGSTWEVQDLDGDGYTLADGDCWDGSDGPASGAVSGADVHPGATDLWYDGIDADCGGDEDFDADRDGYVLDEHVGVATHGVPGTGTLPGGDCDDANSDIRPDQVEIWYDGVDANCDGNDCDADGDTHLSQVAGCDGDDCDDGNPMVHPGGDIAEVWYDGVDQDCDGNDQDHDGDGYGAAQDCNDNDTTIHPTADEVWYDGVDQDCDGNDCDADGDGFDVTASLCTGDDCDDSRGSVYPGATDAWYDGTDADCAEDDDFDADRDGAPTDRFGGTDCDDLNPEIGPAETEFCDLVDNDCDGSTDESDAADAITCYADQDSDTWGDAFYTVRACFSCPLDWVLDDTDCDDTSASISPSGTETCDDADQDEDCDGLADDADSSPEGRSTWFRDADGDSYGSGTSPTRKACDPPSGYAAVASDCDDADPTTYPGSLEVWYDGTDQDCDDNDGDQDGDRVYVLDYGYGVPSGYTEGDCDDKDPEILPGGIETWYDGADQDCDGNDGDQDGDGVYWESYAWDVPPSYLAGDCDDGDPARYPDAMEDADNVDNDCDDITDEGTLAFGDLVITEIMTLPSTWSATDQWFEVQNVSGRDLVLSGLQAQVTDISSEASFYLGVDGVSVAAGDYAVLCGSDSTLGASCDYAWFRNIHGTSAAGTTWSSLFKFNPDAATLSLYLDGTLLDSVSWWSSEWPSFTGGVAMECSLSWANATDNDTAIHWCGAATQWDTWLSPDYGTPGTVNACP